VADVARALAAGPARGSRRRPDRAGGERLVPRRSEQEQGWTGIRPPCPTLTAAAYAAKGYSAQERTTDYRDVTFTRQFGHVMCKDIDTPGGWGFLSHPVCQFTSPTAVRVRADRREAFFEPGPGRLATVSVERGRAACAIGGRFTLYSDPTN
jgi:hypothetical protein